MASVSKRTWTYKGQSRTSWVVRYTDMGGKRRLKTCVSKKDADLERTRIEKEVETGMHVAARASSTVADAAEKYLSFTRTQVGRATMNTYESIARKYIVPGMGGTKLVDLTGPIIQAYFDRMRGKGCSPKSCRKIKMVFGQILDYAARRGFVAHNILRAAPPQLQALNDDGRTIPTMEEIALILAKTRERKESHGYKSIRTLTLIHLAIFTGLRQGELRALTWENVDLKNGIIHVRQALDRWGEVKKPKTKKGIRAVPIHPELVQILREWKLAQPNQQSGYVFTTKFGKPLGPSAAMSIWTVHLHYCGLTHWPGPDEKPLQRSKHKYGLPNYRFHDMRHVAASLWIKNNIPLKELQTYIGHSSVQLTLDRYGHLFQTKDAGSAIIRAADEILAV